MNQIARQGEKKLFKYYIDQSLKEQASHKNFYHRVNRWRFNTGDKSTFFKVLRPTGPLCFTIGCIVVFDWTYGLLRKEAH